MSILLNYQYIACILYYGSASSRWFQTSFDVVTYKSKLSFSCSHLFRYFSNIKGTYAFREINKLFFIFQQTQISNILLYMFNLDLVLVWVYWFVYLFMFDTHGFTLMKTDSCNVDRGRPGSIHMLKGYSHWSTAEHGLTRVFQLLPILHTAISNSRSDWLLYNCRSQYYKSNILRGRKFGSIKLALFMFVIFVVLFESMFQFDGI